MNVQCSGGSRSFAKGKSTLKLRSIVTSHRKLTTVNGEQSSKTILLQLHKKLLKNSMLTILWSFGIWSKWKKWKNSICGCFINWLQIKKIVLLKCFLLFYTKTMNHFLIRLWHAMKSAFYTTTDQLSGWTEMTSLVTGLRRCSKAFPKAKLSSEKGHSHCLVVCCLSDLRQLFESQWSYYSWEVFSTNRWDAPKTATPATSSWSTKKPNSSPWQCLALRHPTTASKVERIGLRSFAPFVIFTWSLTNWLPLLQASQQLCRQSASTGSRKYFLRVCQIPKHGFLHYRNKKFISHWQKCVACNGSYFD